MVLEILLLFLVVSAILLAVYKGAVQEYQILQKDWSPTIDWSSLLSEKLPIVIRNVDPEWQGRWTRDATQHKNWPLVVKDEHGTLLRTTWSEWLSSPPGQPPMHNGHELAEVAHIPLDQWRDGGFRQWSWLPLNYANVGVLGPHVDTVLPTEKTKSACTIVQATDGIPLQIWLAHEGSVPASVADHLMGRNPWSLKSEQVPWIEELKYIEIKLRPGNAIAIPTHWWWAARAALPAVSERPVMADGAWYWVAHAENPVSWTVNVLTKKSNEKMNT
jgi:hypothetical protein